jgi:hypothetical protein
MKDKLEFLIDWYKREEDRKNSLETSLNIPIGILTIVFAVHFFLVRDFDYTNSSILERGVFLTSIIISVIAALVTVYLVLKSYHNIESEYLYNGLPFPSQLFKYEKDLIDFYKENAADFGEVDGKEKFKEYLTEKFTEHIDRNAANNDNKSNFLHQSKRFIFVTLAFMVISFVPYLTNLFDRPAKPDQVEIINLQSISDRLELIEKSIKENQDYGRRDAKTDTTTTTTGQTN